MVVAALRSALPGVPISTEVPQGRPTRMVMVARTGNHGVTDEFVDRGTYELQCWGQSDADASSLALSAFAALSDAALDHPYMSSVSMETLGRDEFTQTGAARYRVVVDVTANR